MEKDILALTDYIIHTASEADLLGENFINIDRSKVL